MIRLVPLALLVVLVAVLFTASFSGRVDVFITRLSFRLFGGREIAYNHRRERLLRSAAMGVPYREYASKTYLYTVLTATLSAFAGLYLGAMVFALADVYGFGTDPLSFAGVGVMIEPIPVAVLVLISVFFGVSAGVSTYFLRWRLPMIRAGLRRRQIDAGLPRLVAFMYALSRGGMSIPDVFRTVAANKSVFDEGAAEIETAVRQMDLFNVDLVTAVEDLSDQTPSEQFSTFMENFASVLQSGGSVSGFLDEQYERYREEAEDQQTEILNLLATTAEVYVTVVVAGMLFFITILLIIGLTVGETLVFMQAIAYIILPAANLLFLMYLLEITQPLRAGGRSRDEQSTREQSVVHPSAQTDGGYTRPNSVTNHGRLHAFRRVRSLRETIATPVTSVINRPVRLLYVTVPIAVGMTAYRLSGTTVGGGFDIRVFDDLLVQAAIFVMGTFAVVYEYKKRRLTRLESDIPDLLDRLASLNEAGVAVVASLNRIRHSDVGTLDVEVERLWRDMNWGATASKALLRFEKRVQTASVTRIVTLITNAMRASNEIGPVLRIAADQARADLGLRKQRKQEMFTYLVVIYVSFLVFLVVIVALEQVLIPNLPDTSAISDGPAIVPGLGGGNVDREAYRLVFFHTALIQSVLSGLVAGVMGNGSVKDGMKHTTAMLTITYLVLHVLV